MDGRKIGGKEGRKEGWKERRKEGRKEGRKELWSEAGEDFPLSEANREISINKYKYENLCERCKGKKNYSIYVQGNYFSIKSSEDEKCK